VKVKYTGCRVICQLRGPRDSAELKAEKFAVARGQLIRLVIHPSRWWGSDMTKVELRIERVDTKD